MTGQPPDPGSSAENQQKAKDLAALLSDLIELWKEYPANLDDPVRDVTRATLADFMSWAESLFGSDHPISITIGYLSTVGEYSRSQLPKDKQLTYRDALEFAVMLRSLIRSWLKSEIGPGDRQASRARPIPRNNPTEGRPYNPTKAHKSDPLSIHDRIAY
jgi:hypothetical protein